MPDLIRRNAKAFTALLFVASLFLALSYSLSVDDKEVGEAAARFGFSRSSLPEVAGPLVVSAARGLVLHFEAARSTPPKVGDGLQPFGY